MLVTVKGAGIMKWVLLAAGGIAVSTLVGSIIGYFFKSISQKAYDGIIGFSSGIMICAALFGLIEPSLEYGNSFSVITVCIGIISGALFLSLIDKVTSGLKDVIGINSKREQGRVLLLVSAIAIHHFPEGIAAGVSFGSGNVSEIILVCGGIAIQNLPEAAIIIAPLISSGVTKSKAIVIAFISGAFEIAGTFIGYFAVNLSNAIMPFALAFAGGSMMYIIIDEMIPQTHTHSYGGIASYSALAGFCAMLGLDSLLELLLS